jgi:hypothetical protein
MQVLHAQKAWLNKEYTYGAPMYSVSIRVFCQHLVTTVIGSVSVSKNGFA